MNKLQIEQLLSTQKVQSISDIISFVIEQVSKTISQQPMDQIHFRLTQLQKPKGLDVIMIEEVKTIVEAMIDQRQQNIRFDFDKSLNQQYENIQHLISNINTNIQTNSKNSRQSLAEIDIANFLNTNSFNTKAEDQFKKNRQSFKEYFSKQLTRDNLLSDCNRFKQSLITERKQVNDLKYSIMQINRQISNKITLEQAHTIITDFESRMYHKIQNEKLQLQKLQFNVKKQLQQQILKVRKETFSDFDYEGLKKQICTVKKLSEKIEKKLDKYKQETKTLMKNFKILQKQEHRIQKQFEKHTKSFDEYCELNNVKNHDLGVILEEINQKLCYFDKIDLIEQKIKLLTQMNVKAQWMTECKTKNQNIVWEREVYNFSPSLFKFQSQKSHILVNEAGIYQMQLNLFESKSSHVSGLLQVQSMGLQVSSKKQFKSTGTNSFKWIVEISQKSTIALKFSGGQNSGSIGGKGTFKVSKY